MDSNTLTVHEEGAQALRKTVSRELRHMRGMRLTQTFFRLSATAHVGEHSLPHNQTVPGRLCVHVSRSATHGVQ